VPRYALRIEPFRRLLSRAESSCLPLDAFDKGNTVSSVNRSLVSCFVGPNKALRGIPCPRFDLSVWSAAFLSSGVQNLCSCRFHATLQLWKYHFRPPSAQTCLTRVAGFAGGRLTGLRYQRIVVLRSHGFYPVACILSLTSSLCLRLHLPLLAGELEGLRNSSGGRMPLFRPRGAPW
jgi:hypothetical protein